MAKGLGIPKRIRWKMIRRTSRDNARTPMQWSAGENAGFSSAKPWLKINANYQEINVESEQNKNDGVLAFWKEMIALRKSSRVLQDGSFKSVYESREIYAFERELDGEILTTICNMTGKVQKLPHRWYQGEMVKSSYKSYDAQTLKPFEFRLTKEERLK
jgi:oligo-1,6-glucosidase